MDRSGHPSGLNSNWAQEKGRQMPAAVISVVRLRRRPWSWLRGTARSSLVQASNRRRPAFALRPRIASMAAIVLARRWRALTLASARLAAHPGDRLTDQFLDCRDALLVGRGHYGDGCARASGAPGTPDAVNVIVGVMRHVEIEHMAHRRDVEAAGRDVGSDQQRDLALAELIERGHARRLVHVAMQRHSRETVADQRAVQLRNLALAVAEHDGVLQTFGGTDQAAQRVALVVRLATGLDQELAGGGDGGRRLRHLDA